MIKKIYINLIKFYICRIKRLGLPYGLRYRQLYELIKENKTQNILEIGVHNGENAIRMINVNKDISVNYFGIDLFEDITDELYKNEIAIQPSPLEIVKKKLKNNTNSKTQLFKVNTMKINDKFLNKLPKMDLIFIDGGHSIETQRNDWNLAKKLMHKKTLVIIDDYWNLPNTGCSFLIEELNRNFDYKILPITDYFLKDWGVLSTQFLLITYKNQ